MPNMEIPLPERLKRCDDHLVDFRWNGPIDLGDGGSRRRVPAVRGETGPWLILVLESPHVREFMGPPEHWGPVRGASGARIRRHLGTILAAAPPRVQEKARTCRGLVLMNAVQYQCSEGERPITTKAGAPKTNARGQARMGLDERLRNSNFTAIWMDHGGREDFLERLDRVHRPMDLLVNACTKGDQNLRGLVAAALDPGRFPVDLDCYHPSCWNHPGLRIFRNPSQPPLR